MIQDVGWVRGQPEWHELTLSTCVSAWWGGRPVMPGGRRSVWSERRRKRGEVVATLAGDRQRGGQSDGRAGSLRS